MNFPNRVAVICRFPIYVDKIRRVKGEGGYNDRNNTKMNYFNLSHLAMSVIRKWTPVTFRDPLEISKSVQSVGLAINIYRETSIRFSNKFIILELQSGMVWGCVLWIGKATPACGHTPRDINILGVWCRINSCNCCHFTTLTHPPTFPISKCYR